MKVLEKISDFAGKWMAIIALAVAIIAFVAPAPVHAALPTSWVNPLLGIVMFGMGMTLKLGDFKGVFTKPKAVITGILSQFIIMPLIAWVLCLVFQLPTELAVGVMLVGCCPGGTSSNVMTYLSKGDVALSVVLSVTVLALYLLFYHQIFAVTFDESFSRATGLKVEACNTLLAILTALTIVLGMRMMGAMLISSLVIFPALTAMRLFRSFRGVILCAAVTSVVCFCVGLTISFAFSTPVGATVVAADLTVFLLSCLTAALRRKA